MKITPTILSLCAALAFFIIAALILAGLIDGATNTALAWAAGAGAALVLAKLV
jgi:hypothetical protein